MVTPFALLLRLVELLRAVELLTCAEFVRFVELVRFEELPRCVEVLSVVDDGCRWVLSIWLGVVPLSSFSELASVRLSLRKGVSSHHASKTITHF